MGGAIDAISARRELVLQRAAELDGAAGLGCDGGMAPPLLVPQARWLVPLDDLDPVEAAPLTDAGLTPYHAIKRSLHLLHGGSTAVVIEPEAWGIWPSRS